MCICQFTDLFFVLHYVMLVFTMGYYRSFKNIRLSQYVHNKLIFFFITPFWNKEYLVKSRATLDACSDFCQNDIN